MMKIVINDYFHHESVGVLVLIQIKGLEAFSSMVVFKKIKRSYPVL